jgi:hypothetical protein
VLTLAPAPVNAVDLTFVQALGGAVAAAAAGAACLALVVTGSREHRAPANCGQRFVKPLIPIKAASSAPSRTRAWKIRASAMAPTGPE